MAETATLQPIYHMSRPEELTEWGWTEDTAHLSSRQMLCFIAAVRTGNLLELQQYFSKFAQLTQQRPEGAYVPSRQLAAGLVHVLSEEGREHTPQFHDCLQLLSLASPTHAPAWLLERTYEVARQAELLLGENQRQRAPSSGTLLDSIVQYVSRAYADEALSLTTTAKELGFSAGYLGDYFKRTAGINFTDYLISVRLEKAKELLQSTTSKAYEVAFACGFSNPHYFSVVFKKHVGMTPSQFRDRSGTASQKL